jgi:serine protease
MSNDVVPRVVVKFKEEVELPDGDEFLADPDRFGLTEWNDLKGRFPGITLKRLFSGASSNKLAALTERAADADPSFRPTKLQNYYAVDCPPEIDPEDLAEEVSNWPSVQKAYVEGGPTQPPSVNPSDDPHRPNQRYLDPAPVGIDAEHAWRLPGGDGSGIKFIDLEQGWTLEHEDLASADIELISGVSLEYFGHGTAVLGQVLASDNKLGCIGIAPKVRAGVVSQYRTPSVFNTAEAIVDALSKLSFGDVLLLEAQTQVSDYSLLPIEVEDALFTVIRTGTAAGVTIIEAAGNGSINLDTYTDSEGKRVLNRASSDFKDSGAIMVGAAESAPPHGRLPISNYGSRIDCYGWGQHIVTAGNGKSGTSTVAYTKKFGGTSGASAIIAGTAIVVQGVVEAKFSRRFSPAQLRVLLSHAPN